MKINQGDSRNIQVFVRVRPHNSRELQENYRTLVRVIDSSTLLFDPDDDEDEFFYQGVKQAHRDITKKMKKKLTMEFDGVFDEESSNEDVFEKCTKPLVSSVMNGYNCSVFVYGATGAGKTFTMLGNKEYPGITILTIRELFDKIEEFSNQYKFDIGITYLEVYNELVRNLLEKSGPLKLREDANGVVVRDLKLKQIHSADELFQLLIFGNQNRTQHPTDANEESSRSHAIFQIHIRMTDNKTKQKRTVKLSMIDLAGSERAASTKGIGVRFKEGASINKSLLALGNCINKLADGLKHIPYRDSNLTRILKDSLGGNCQTVMIANASPSSMTYEDTYNTLKYASRAKNIRTVIKQNAMKLNMPNDYYVKKYCEQQKEMDRLKNLVKELEGKNNNFAGSFNKTELQSWYSKINEVYGTVINAQEHYLSMQSKEKILMFRNQLKEYAEGRKNILTLDGSKLDQDTGRLEASIDRFNKQIIKQKEDMDRWRKRFHDAIKDLAQLRKEVESSCWADILVYFIKGKDSEIESSKDGIKINHIRKINTLIHAESEYLRKIVLLSCEVAQNNYLVLRASGNLDCKLQENLSKLASLINRRREVSIDIDGEEDHNYDNITCSELENITILDDGISNKRKNSDDSIESCRTGKILKLNGIEMLSPEKTTSNTVGSVFKCPLPPAQSSSFNHYPNLNETCVISSSDTNSLLNTTYQMPGEFSATSTTSNDELIENVLGNHNIIAKNRLLLNKALAKNNVTRETLLNKVAVVLNKENKRFSPNRVGKSPKSRTVANRALTLAINASNRHRTKTPIQSAQNDVDAIKVRVNRAAAMRLRK